MSDTVKAIHCVNQFFGGLGGEELADTTLRLVVGPVGPGVLLQKLAPEIEIVGTIVFGDNYVAQHTQEAVTEIVAVISERLESLPSPPGLVLAGPAFQAGRYGLGCGAICQAVQERLRIPAITAMSMENPGVDSFRKSVTIVKTTEDVMGMNAALEGMVRVGLKLVAGERIDPANDGTILRGLRENYLADACGAERALDMLLKKLHGEVFETEYPMPVFDRVAPAPAVADISQATLALVTSGGIVPRGNPDRIPAASAQKYGEYSLEGLERLTSATHQTVHGGYDPTYANADPNRVLPLDVVRQLEYEGRIDRLHEHYFATVGNATSVANAKRFGAEIAARLKQAGVHAVILTST